MKSLPSQFYQQLNLFYLALSFFTRIPVPQSIQYSPELLSQSNRYFSLVGLLLGAILALFYYVATQFFGIEVAILLIMTLSLLLTGAFHEDGLADMADGLGGGYSTEQCLTIMKDSRIGTYGTVTLVMALALKFSLLVEIANHGAMLIVSALLLSQSLSRAVAASLITSLSYVSEEGNNKSKPLATTQTSTDITILVIVGCLPLLFYGVKFVLGCLLALIIFRKFFIRFLNKKIGGFTGDCLGAAQQLAEILILMVAVMFLNNSMLGGVI